MRNMLRAEALTLNHFWNMIAAIGDKFHPELLHKFLLKPKSEVSEMWF